MSQPAPEGDSAKAQGPRPAPHYSHPRLGHGPAPRRSIGASTPEARTAAAEPALHLRSRVRLVGGEAGQAVAAAQGRALADLLASLAPVEVGQEQEDTP